MSGWKKKRSIMRHYDQSAKVYDLQYSEEQEAKILTILDELQIDENVAILDVGCGTALLFEHLPKRVKLTVGTDISRGLLKEALRRTKNLDGAGLILADADNLPFFNDVFDAIFAITVIQNAPAPISTVDEVRRVGKVKSKIVVTGLRKTFDEQGFVKVLKQAELEVEILKLDPYRRDYVAICTKRR
jgi:ubiquinone/menaquinone biosynthesis C-methylase UbiE